MHRMMRLWFLSYVQPRRVAGAAALSVVVHLASIGMSVYATRPVDELSNESLAGSHQRGSMGERQGHSWK